MDDAAGAVRPEASQRFTMRLDSDGSVSMELDCNRATGTWTAEPSEDGQSGRFEFGPLAVTRALCSPPNLFDAENATDVCNRVTGCGDLDLGDPIAWQLPRRYELGLRVEF